MTQNTHRSLAQFTKTPRLCHRNSNRRGASNTSNRGIQNLAHGVKHFWEIFPMTQSMKRVGKGWSGFGGRSTLRPNNIALQAAAAAPVPARQRRERDEHNDMNAHDPSDQGDPGNDAGNDANDPGGASGGFGG